MTDALIQALKAKQAEWAVGALTLPAEKTEFGYGYASGVLNGLLMAEQLYLDLLRDRDQKGRDL